MKRITFRKRPTLITAAVVIALAGGIALAASPEPSKATDSPVATKLNEHDDKLANHEARITNVENDVKVVQDKTATAPSDKRVDVPAVPTNNQEQGGVSISTRVPEPKPTVVSFEEVPVDNLNTDCKLTYSDGSTYVWRWMVINPHGSWQTDGVGQNGKWIETKNTLNRCDDTVVGKEKIN